MPAIAKVSRVTVLLLIALCLAVASSALSLTADEQRLLSHICGSEIKSKVFGLCDDRFAGRRAGTRGQELAAQHIAKEFERLGKDRIADNYVHDLTMRYALVKSVHDIKATLIYHDGRFEKQQVFAYPNFHGRGGVEINAPVIYAGEGIVDSSTGRDDYAGIDAENKVVAILASSAGKAGSVASVPGRVLSAYQKGASAVLVVGLKNPIDQQYGGFGLAGAIANFPCLSIRHDTARSIFPGTWDKLANGSVSGAVRTGGNVRISVPEIYNPEQPTQNVMAQLPPSKDSEEFILVGAHYDHLGQCPTGKIFHGADDNASGTAVMLEVAKAFAESGLKPARGIVFAAWTGEECGLIGSNHFVKDPPIALDKLRAALNLDMVGLGERGVYKTAGRATCPELFETLSQSAADLGMRLLPDEIRAASDHLAFSRKGISSMLLHSAGERPNYHTVRDRPELIDPVILENTAKLVALTVWRLAQESQ